MDIQNLNSLLGCLLYYENRKTFVDEFNTYCTELETTPAWGGQLEVCKKIAFHIVKIIFLFGGTKSPHEIFPCYCYCIYRQDFSTSKMSF